MDLIIIIGLMLFALFHIGNKGDEENDTNRYIKNIKRLNSENQILSSANKDLKNEINKLKKKYNERCNERLYKMVDEIIEKEFEELDNLECHLKNKDFPALKAAEKVKIATGKIREYEKKYKLMKYEYDLLFELFPELENYIETIDGHEEEQKSLDKLKEDYDCVRQWLKPEEYNAKPVDERNQLALDRYIESRQKSKWQIGRDYEMYIGYLYEKSGYKVTYMGIEKKLEDMGRDLIAENDNEVLIVQCKYWSKDKVIHEKHICQLFGTAVHYKRTNDIKKDVIPVFVTKTNLSETARDFADFLNVKVIENKELVEFPRIKCNIGKGGERIYHLPFDQQYDRTIIDKNSDECFAYTVAEAVEKGFRRAKKYIGIYS